MKPTLVIAEENASTLNNMMQQFAKDFDIVSSTSQGDELYNIVKEKNLTWLLWTLSCLTMTAL